MAKSRQLTPPLSPVLFVGFALRPVPRVLLQPFIELAMAAMLRRHRDLFERLQTLKDPIFLIDPVDLPFSFLLRPSLPMPSLRLLEDDHHLLEPTATIRGPLLALLDLLEGRLDGDALFFSRDIVVEGNTEAVVALRNAVDAVEIDVVEDLLSVLGPLAGLARRVVRHGGTLFARSAADLKSLRDAFNAPVVRRCDCQAAELRELKTKVWALGRQIRRTKLKADHAAETGTRQPRWQSR